MAYVNDQTRSKGRLFRIKQYADGSGLATSYRGPEVEIGQFVHVSLKTPVGQVDGQVFDVFFSERLGFWFIEMHVFVGFLWCRYYLYNLTLICIYIYIYII